MNTKTLNETIAGLRANWDAATTQRTIFEDMLTHGIFDEQNIENLSQANKLTYAEYCRLASGRNPNGRGTYASNMTALKYRRGQDGKWEFTPPAELKRLEERWDHVQRGNSRRKNGRSIEEVRVDIGEVNCQHRALQEGLDALPEDNPAREFLQKQLAALQDRRAALHEEEKKVRRGTNAELIRRARSAIIFCSNAGSTVDPLIDWLEMTEALYPREQEDTRD